MISTERGQRGVDSQTERIDPDYRMPLEASRSPRDFIARKLKAKSAVHR